MTIRPAIAVLLLAACAAPIATTRAQEVSRNAAVVRAEFSGQQLELVLRAWSALQTAYENDASLADFVVTYTQIEGRAPTIAFFKPATFTQNADGSISLGSDAEYYVVVVDGSAIYINVGELTPPLRN